MTSTTSTIDRRAARAEAIAADAGQWIKIRFTDGAKAYGVPSRRLGFETTGQGGKQ
jgi:hypothetical protein